MDLTHTFFLGTESELTATRLLLPGTTSQRNKVCARLSGGGGGGTHFFLDSGHKDRGDFGLSRNRWRGSRPRPAPALTRSDSRVACHGSLAAFRRGRGQWEGAGRREVPTAIRGAVSVSAPAATAASHLLHMWTGKTPFRQRVQSLKGCRFKSSSVRVCLSTNNYFCR